MPWYYIYLGLSLGIFLFTSKAYSLYKSLYAVKSLVAQLAPSRVFNGDVLSSNLLSPSCNYRIINKKEKKINVLCIYTQSKINEIHTKFTFLHGIKACSLKFELCHHSSDFKKLKTPCVGLNLLRTMYPHKKESVRTMVQWLNSLLPNKFKLLVLGVIITLFELSFQLGLPCLH